ncbi:MAG: BBP7 family outer membrane beta-barrel protein [Verrucomicrobia bacterium]|nr:BBP7 family outer membrane beta-barrel protein [Verrucomicrobiota bacterium]MBS0645589.1 BBP7 family outer membrane beta-barrel protein [Verrucomicrobiota bacterium]
MSRWIILGLLMMTSLFAGPCGSSSPFVLPGWWTDVDYLLVWRRERYYPALATTSPIGTVPANAGVLGLSTTSILFGQGNIGRSPASGVQGDMGVWLTRCLGFGIGAFSLGTESKGITYTGNGSGVPILARPYTDVTVPAQASQLISYPTQQSYADFIINTDNRIWGFDLYARLRRISKKAIACDLLGGYFSTQFTDSCDVTTWSVPAGGVGRLHREDHFHCQNNYYAGLVGFDVEWRFLGGIRLDVTGKAGLGNMVQTTIISGTSTTAGGATNPGGLLALPSNIGNYCQGVFEVCTLLEGFLRCTLAGHVNMEVGYNFFYLPSVQLAGRAIDMNLNTTQQDGGALTGAIAPTFTADTQSFWTQALSVGLYFVY